VIASAFDPSSLVDAIGRVEPSLPLAERLVAAVGLMQAHGRRLAGLVHAFAARRTLPDRQERAPQIRMAEARVIDALAMLVLPDRDQLRCPPLETARRLRLVTLALSSPRLVDTDPLPPEEIVSLLLDGLRRRPEPHAQERASAPATTSIGASAC
jgi:hypothetical protein